MQQPTAPRRQYDPPHDQRERSKPWVFLTAVAMVCITLIAMCGFAAWSVKP